MASRLNIFFPTIHRWLQLFFSLPRALRTPGAPLHVSNSESRAIYFRNCITIREAKRRLRRINRERQQKKWMQCMRTNHNRFRLCCLPDGECNSKIDCELFMWCIWEFYGISNQAIWISCHSAWLRETSEICSLHCRPRCWYLTSFMLFFGKRKARRAKKASAHHLHIFSPRK